MRTVWLDPGIKIAQFPREIAQNVDTHFLNNRVIIKNNPKTHQNIWATFVRQFVAKNFQKFAQSGHTIFVLRQLMRNNQKQILMLSLGTKGTPSISSYYRKLRL